AFAYYAPFNDTLSDDHADCANGACDALTYHMRGGFRRANFATLALSLHVSSLLSIGGGLSLVMAHADLRFNRDRGIDACASPPCQLGQGALSEQYDVATTKGFWTVDFELGFNVGVLFRIPDVPRLTFGVCWVTQPSKSVGNTEQADAE